MKTSDQFWDGIADRYARRRISDEASYAETLARSRACLNATDHMLEVGCGTGTTAQKLAPFVDHVTAIDSAARMIGIARSRAAEQNVANVTFLHATIDDLADGDETFDVVAAYNLLHLLEDIPAFLTGIRSVLRPGGMFLSKTPCLAEKTVLLRPLIWGMQKAGMAPMVRFFNAMDLEQMIRDAGFDIIEADHIPARTGPRFIIARRI